MLTFGALLLFAGPPAPLGEGPELAPIEQAAAQTPPTEQQPGPDAAAPTEQLTLAPPPASPSSAPASTEQPGPDLQPAWIEPPPPVLILPPPTPTPRTKRCLPGVEPCIRTTSSRLLLAGLGVISTGASVALVFSAGDRNRLGDPAMSFAGGGLVAVGAAVLGGAVSLLGGDGPGLPDRITPPTFGLALGLGGSDVSDESLPYRLTGSIAPTWTFPRARGRLRLLGSFGAVLGPQLERDPRPQTSNPDGTFAVALEGKRRHFDLGLDLALNLPYPLAQRRPAWLGQLELRYKPLVFFARDSLTLGDEQRVSERVALTPLNFGLRWHISPRQRFTFYMGPRWDLNSYGEPANVARGAPTLGPIYSESWFDLDVPIQKAARARRAAVVGQLTLGYVHSRFASQGLNSGSIVGFLGHMVTQFSIRVRPRASLVAYQIDFGARIGGGLNPYLRVGVVLPNLGDKQRGNKP